ncbi:MAG: 2-phosphosulfolactate phosphatase [Thermoanaerobaculia bacterium]
MTSIASKSFARNDIVGGVLHGFNVFCSLTPSSFAAKIEHFDAGQRKATAGIFIDVLRATTTLNVIGARGVEGVHLAVKPRVGGYDFTPPVFPEATWLFDGEEHGRPIAGGSIGNSPAAAANEQFDGAFLKFFSTNGARALEALVSAKLGGVYLMSMANIETTMAKVVAAGFENVWLLAGGFYGSMTLEDTVCCGRAIAWLVEHAEKRETDLDDESRIALHTAATYREDDDRLVRDLSDSQVAKLLHMIGHGADVSISVDGRGLSSRLWLRMRDTIMSLTTVGATHLLVPQYLSAVRS